MQKPTIKVLKNVCHPSDDGYLIDATIEVDGHKVAYFDGGFGGGGEFRAAKPYGKAPTKKQEEEAEKALAILRDYCASLPAERTDAGGGRFFDYRPDPDAIVCAALDRADSEKKALRDLKTKVLFVIPGEKGVSYFALKQRGRVFPYAEVEAVALKKHPTAVILNRLPVEKAVETYLANVASR